MDHIANFVLMSLILWLGIERACEVFIRFWDRKSDKFVDFGDYRRDERIFRDIENDWRQTYKIERQRIMTDMKDNPSGAAKALVELAKNFTEMNETFDKQRKTALGDKVGLLSLRKREFGIYIFSFCIGMIIGFIDLGLLHALHLDGIFTFFEDWDIPQRVMDIILTALVFAGGPELIHQVLTLVEEAKNKIKLS